ncbi:P-selectin glycoprotein ligand 1 isoform X2 [Mus pahari]|uniref:P-selectin glycoprotein ligand 1 isoform X2 n=1 Tax=Mus pahari TaxID=10093 RepID=UPI001114F96B|nr:P-selectin glycoprotein ligand 1 isoform X2 [Mus pahari]
MFLSFLVLLTILGSGNSLPLRDSWEQETTEAPGPVHLRERRQTVEDDDLEDPDYMYNTDPPELLKNVTNTVAAHPELLTTVVMLERVSVSIGTSETATLKVATTGPAGPGTGGPAVGMLSTDSATQWSLTTTETIPPTSTEAETSQPTPTEAETSQPTPTEAETSQPTPTEAETSQPTPTEAETSQSTPTEAETSQSTPTEAETTQLPRIRAVKSLFTTSAATEAPSTEPTTMEMASPESNESAIFLGPSVTHLPDSGLKKGLIVTPGSSRAPPGSSDLIPVKQCLLIILILASLATIFLVCTVVLAVRLSRHWIPVLAFSKKTQLPYPTPKSDSIGCRGNPAREKLCGRPPCLLL